MSVKSYFEEFNRRYNQPQVNHVTVGFSGISPELKSSYITGQDDNDPSQGGSGSTTVHSQGGSNQYQVMDDDDFNSMMDDVFGN